MGLEPTTFAVTGRRCNQLNYAPAEKPVTRRPRVNAGLIRCPCPIFIFLRNAENDLWRYSRESAGQSIVAFRFSVPVCPIARAVRYSMMSEDSYLQRDCPISSMRRQGTLSLPPCFTSSFQAV